MVAKSGVRLLFQRAQVGTTSYLLPSRIGLSRWAGATRLSQSSIVAGGCVRIVRLASTMRKRNCPSLQRCRAVQIMLEVAPETVPRQAPYAPNHSPTCRCDNPHRAHCPKRLAAGNRVPFNLIVTAVCAGHVGNGRPQPKKLGRNAALYACAHAQVRSGYGFQGRSRIRSQWREDRMSTAALPPQGRLTPPPPKPPLRH